MTRWIAVIACTLALGLTIPMGMDAEAAKAKKGKNLACTATAIDGKKASWSCKAGEKCCYDWLMSKGTCVAGTAACL